MVKQKVDMIKKLLASAAKDGDEAKYIVRALEGKMRLGLADKTLEAALSQAVVAWEQEKLGKTATLKQMQEGEEILRSVYRYTLKHPIVLRVLTRFLVSCQVTRSSFLRCWSMASSIFESTAVCSQAFL